MKKKLCSILCSLLKSAGHEASGEGHEVELVSLKQVGEAAVVGRVKR